MALGLDFKVMGAEQLQRKLSNLKRSAANRIWRKGMRQAVTPILQSARKRAPVFTRRLLKSLGSKVKTYKKGVGAVGLVGPRRGFAAVIRGRRVNPTRYAHLAERQTPFLGPAARENQDKASRILADVARTEIMALVR